MFARLVVGCHDGERNIIRQGRGHHVIPDDSKINVTTVLSYLYARTIGNKNIFNKSKMICTFYNFFTVYYRWG